MIWYDDAPQVYAGIYDVFQKTAELAGFTVNKGNKRHYLLADLALVGEAITLAMRTAVPWK